VALLASDHALKHVAREEHRCLDVDVDHQVDLLVGEAVIRTEDLGHRRVVDQHVDRAERLLATLHQRAHVLAVAQIGGQRLRHGAALAQLVAQRVQDVGLAAGDPDLHALRGKLARDRGADAARCAGHERDAAFQFSHYLLLSTCLVAPSQRPRQASSAT
jgi:hypothetical protein